MVCWSSSKKWMYLWLKAQVRNFLSWFGERVLTWRLPCCRLDFSLWAAEKWVEGSDLFSAWSAYGLITWWHFLRSGESRCRTLINWLLQDRIHRSTRSFGVHSHLLHFEESTVYNLHKLNWDCLWSMNVTCLSKSETDLVSGLVQ